MLITGSYAVVPSIAIFENEVSASASARFATAAARGTQPTWEASRGPTNNSGFRGRENSVALHLALDRAQMISVYRFVKALCSQLNHSNCGSSRA